MNVLVAGGGIAGLSAGIAMKKAGHRVVVAERTTELREIGAALSLWPNALSALDFLEVGDSVRAASVVAPTASIHRSNGSAIVRFDTEAMRRALGGFPVVVLRARLQQVLAEACGALGVEIRLGERVETVEVTGPCIAVETSAGRGLFDALIGADGIHSTVRSAVTTDRVRDCNRISWRAVIPNRNGLISDAWLSVGLGLQLIASPAPGHHAYWAADTPGSDAPVDGDAADPLDILRRRFGTWHAPIPEILDATAADALIISSVSDRIPPQTLHRGSILLVGDAAHAMTPDLGQGACQAIEDAAMLLACARSRPTVGPADLFGLFERIRLPRLRHIVRDSHGIGRLAGASSTMTAGARDLFTRLLPERLTNRRLAVYASEAAFRRQLRAVNGPE